MKNSVGVIACVILITACAGSKKTDPVPALLSESNVQAHKEISALIAESIGQSSVRLAGNIFKKRSVVLLSKPDLTGRVLEQPTQFLLLKQGDQCILERLDNNINNNTNNNTKNHTRWILKHVECMPE